MCTSQGCLVPCVSQRHSPDLTKTLDFVNFHECKKHFHLCHCFQRSPSILIQFRLIGISWMIPIANRSRGVTQLTGSAKWRHVQTSLSVGSFKALERSAPIPIDKSLFSVGGRTNGFLSCCCQSWARQPFALWSVCEGTNRPVYPHVVVGISATASIELSRKTSCDVDLKQILLAWFWRRSASGLNLIS